MNQVTVFCLISWTKCIVTPLVLISSDIAHNFPSVWYSLHSLSWTIYSWKNISLNKENNNFAIVSFQMLKLPQSLHALHVLPHPTPARPVPGKKFRLRILFCFNPCYYILRNTNYWMEILIASYLFLWILPPIGKMHFVRYMHMQFLDSTPTLWGIILLGQKMTTCWSRMSTATEEPCLMLLLRTIDACTSFLRWSWRICCCKSLVDSSTFTLQHLFTWISSQVCICSLHPLKYVFRCILEL